MKKLILVIGVFINVYSSSSQCFSPAVNYPVGAEVRAVTSADVNGDGKIDLVTANNLLTGNGAGGFTTTTISNLSNNAIKSIVSADFNGDGKIDLAMAEFGVTVLIGNGSGGFSSPNTISLGAYVKNIVSADFNRDGKIDLAAISDIEIKILIGNGVGGFSVTTVTTLTGNPIFTSITTSDFNQDGKMDLVATKNVGYISTLAYLSVFLGNGAGGFSAPTDIMTGGAYPQSITTADLNNDGKMDLATSESNAVTIALGNGSGGFTINHMGNTADYSFITSSDLNGDGNRDLVLRSGPANVTAIWLGNGSGSFSSNSNFDYQVNSESASGTVVSADFNKDGKMDLATSNYYSGSVSVFLGKIKISVNKTDVTTCFGGNNGTATATAACGNNYTYSWNTSPIQASATATGLSAGTYTVTVKEGNASNTATITISDPPPIILNTSAIDASCDGVYKNGEVSCQVSGGTPSYSYTWNTIPIKNTSTVSNLSAGTYSVIVKDSKNCTNSSTVTVNKAYNPSSFSYTITGMVAKFTKNGIGCNSFIWDFGNGNTSTINPNPTVTYATAGTYGVCIQCNGQPSSCVNCINIKVPSFTNGGVGIDEFEKVLGISVYPNPTSGILTIEQNNIIETEVVLYAITGQKVTTKNITSKNNSFDISNYANGIYYLQLKNENGISTKKIVLNK